MRRFWKRWRARWEIYRPIPDYYDWYMTEADRRRWHNDGWRVTYSVNPKTGERV